MGEGRGERGEEGGERERERERELERERGRARARGRHEHQIDDGTIRYRIVPRAITSICE